MNILNTISSFNPDYSPDFTLLKAIYDCIEAFSQQIQDENEIKEIKTMLIKLIAKSSCQCNDELFIIMREKIIHTSKLSPKKYLIFHIVIYSDRSI